MAIVAIANQKGGCAKSTTAVHFAYWLRLKGYQVAVIDADAQRSSSIWFEGIADATVTVEVIQRARRLLQRVPELATQFDYCIIDGPAGLSEATKGILACADLVVVPCQPTGVDLRSAADAIRLIRRVQTARKGLPDVKVVLNRAVKGTLLKNEARERLQKAGIPLLSTIIHQRQVIADTFGQGATVFHLAGSAAIEASQEFEALFTEILATLQA
ncbi:MAG: AAA family ATPase [Leptolyngbyaceae cyanobacterium]